MEKQPNFIREFSKEESQQERDELAHQIRAKRQEFFDAKKSAEQNVEDANASQMETEKELEQKVGEIKNLESRLTEIDEKLSTKILNFVEYMRIRSRLMNRRSEGEELSERTNSQRDAKNQAEQNLSELKLSPEMQEAKNMIDAFYAKQKQKWAESPYSKEDIQKNFNPEHLATLSVDEYVDLLKRFPSQMVTHVTRQGVRDHVGAVNHHAGVNKMWNGFKEIVDDGHLKSSIDMNIVDDEKENAIDEFLNLKNKTKEQAMQEIEYLAGDETQHHHGSFADRMSLHVATEQVADAHYGAETGNEIFFAYPSAMIASQYEFSGQLSKEDGGYHNNQWIFADKGLDINSGLVFIPKNAMVGRETGSRYELDDKMEPIKNEKLVAEIVELISRDGFSDFAETYAKILGTTNVDVEKILFGEGPENASEAEAKTVFDEGLNKLTNAFGLQNETMQKLVMDYYFLNGAASFGKTNDASFIKNRIDQLGLTFELAKDSVPSRDYWENYFADKLEKKPTKIIYYEEADPTTALQNWKKKNGLTKTDKNPDMGFGENRVDLSVPEQVSKKIPRVNKFKALAMERVQNFYGE